MIDGLKSYPSYKPSGLSSLNEVPAHWDVRRAKYFFREADDRSRTGTDELLSVSHITGVTPRSQKDISMFLAESNVGHKLCRPNDVVVNTMWAWMAALGIARQCGIVSPSYAVYRPTPDNRLLPEYVDRLLRTPAYAAEYLCASTGINTSRLRLYPEQFLRILILRPPQEEQALIVRFLDHADRRIGRYIRAKEKLIARLEEQVTARAAEAVRHPACETERLGRIANQHLRSVARDDASAYVALGLYNRGRGVFHKAPTLGADLGDSEFFWVTPGDLVISGQFAWEGAVALASSLENNTIVSHRYHLLGSIEGRSTTPYLMALLRSEFGSLLLDQHSRGAAGRNRPLNIATLLKERVPVPPFEEQLALNDFVRSITPIRVKAEFAICLLREYRTRLIADVVTGKLDVREAAVRLPDVPTTLEDDEFLADEAAAYETAELQEVNVDSEVGA